jgi:hypothetical protein
MCLKFCNKGSFNSKHTCLRIFRTALASQTFFVMSNMATLSRVDLPINELDHLTAL